MEGVIWPIFGVSVCFGIALLVILAGHLSASRRIRLRAIQSEERMRAIDAGLPLPEVDEPLGQNVGANRASYERQIGWFRLLCLALGMLFVFAGVGMGIAFAFVFDEDLRSLAPLGAMPVFAGLGLLLFYWVSRKHAT